MDGSVWSLLRSAFSDQHVWIAASLSLLAWPLTRFEASVREGLIGDLLDAIRARWWRWRRFSRVAQQMLETGQLDEAQARSVEADLRRTISQLEGALDVFDVATSLTRRGLMARWRARVAADAVDANVLRRLTILCDPNALQREQAAVSVQTWLERSSRIHPARELFPTLIRRAEGSEFIQRRAIELARATLSEEDWRWLKKQDDIPAGLLPRTDAVAPPVRPRA